MSSNISFLSMVGLKCCAYVKMILVKDDFMKIDLDVIEHDAKRLEHIYSKAKSKSALKNIGNDLFGFQYLYFGIWGNDDYLRWEDDVLFDDVMQEYYYKKMKQFFTNYTYDINFCFNSSRSVLQAYCDNKFSDLSNVYGNFRRLNKKDAMNILFDFFDSMGDKYYKFFKSLVDNKQIEMGYVGDYSNMAETT